MQIKIFYYLILIIICSINISNAQNKIVIEFLIEDEIITNIDILKERNYLIALNNSLKKLPKEQIIEISKNSIIREKIKKSQLAKIYDFEKADKYSDQILSDFYKKLSFKNEKDLVAYLSNYNLKIEEIKEKLKIEALWNEFIFSKYKDQINVDEKRIKKKIKSQKKYLVEYNLSEILFELNSDELLLDKYDLILKNIKEKGFKNSANIFSISSTSKFGGEIGWISQNQLNEVFLKEIELINTNEFTKPIQTTNGYLILKLNDKKETEAEINFESEFNKMVVEEKNRQLNQFSLIYFNKIKKNIFISEK